MGLQAGAAYKRERCLLYDARRDSQQALLCTFISVCLSLQIALLDSYLAASCGRFFPPRLCGYWKTNWRPSPRGSQHGKRKVLPDVVVCQWHAFPPLAEENGQDCGGGDPVVPDRRG